MHAAHRKMRQVARLPGRFVRAVRRPGLTPINDLQSLGGKAFRSTGHDPQFAINPSFWRRFRQGWAIATVDIASSDRPLRPILYAFSGDGGYQVAPFPLPVVTEGRVRKAIILPAGVRSVRLDPTDTAGVRFSINTATVRNVGKLGLLAYVFSLLDQDARRQAIKALLRCDFATSKAVAQRALAGDGAAEYRAWVALYDTITEEDCARMRAKITQMRSRPVISVVMPVYNSDPRYLRKAIESVVAQTYENWELCIADDASGDAEVKLMLQNYATSDPRIKVVFRTSNGHVSAATNSAIELATGEFIALMDHDDALPMHALYMIADELSRHPDTDLIYTDEDKIDGQDRRHDPHFKSDWNPELFYSQNMIAHMGVYRTGLVRQIGGFRLGFEGSQDYDFALRFLARTDRSRVRHIPHVLYHWRIFPGVSSLSTDNPNKSIETAHRALREYFAQVDPSARVEPIERFPSWWRIKRQPPTPLPRVSLIVPTRDGLDVLRVAVEGLLHATDYENLEVVIVDNGSVEAETLAYFQTLAGDARVKILRIEAPFNFSLLNNRAADVATGSILGFINNDIKVIHADWLTELVVQVTQPGVGAAGAKLYYANDTIQHAGVVLGLYGVAAHGHRHFPRNSVGYFGRPMLVQHLSAVTAACMLVPKPVFQQVGGFCETELAVGYNDVDLCLKIREAGYDIVFTPFAELYHLESVSRGENVSSEQKDRDARERAYMLQRWGGVIAADPFYNPNLTVDTEDFGLAFPPRARKPWTEA